MTIPYIPNELDLLFLDWKSPMDLLELECRETLKRELAEMARIRRKALAKSAIIYLS